jgi:hypothetical protein
MQSCNGRQAVMSALEALVLAGKGLNAYSVLFIIFSPWAVRAQEKPIDFKITYEVNTNFPVGEFHDK